MQKLDQSLIVTLKEQDWIDRTASTIQKEFRKLFSSSDAARSVRDFLHGTWLAHPVHAFTTDVAIGAWTTAQVVDLVETARGQKPSGTGTAAVAVGLAGAVGSAASGLADWSETSGDQKRLGIIHALVNVTGVIFYSASLASRLTGSHGLGKLLGGAGFATILVGGYLGGELAYRLGTQVDRNAWTKTIRDFTPVIGETELAQNTPVRVDAKGVGVLLVRRGERIHAMGDVCSHQGCSLAKGRLEGDKIVCSCHGSTFLLEDGSLVHGPAVYSQPAYETRINDGQIEVRSAQP